MEPPADDIQLLKTALDHARALVKTLGAQRDDLSRVAPGEQEGAGKLARATQAVAEVERALEPILGRQTGCGNPP